MNAQIALNGSLALGQRPNVTISLAAGAEHLRIASLIHDDSQDGDVAPLPLAHRAVAEFATGNQIADKFRHYPNDRGTRLQPPSANAIKILHVAGDREAAFRDAFRFCWQYLRTANGLTLRSPAQSGVMPTKFSTALPRQFDGGI